MSVSQGLFLIDLQPVFSKSGSPWFTPGMDELYKRLAHLVEKYSGRCLFSRFVPPDTELPESGWTQYYNDWSFALTASPDIWELDAEWRGQPEMKTHMFGKWTAESQAFFASTDEIILAGVATDCCVLNTATALIDAGKKVILLRDGCLAANQQISDLTIDLIARRKSHVRVSTIAALLAE